MNNSNINNEGHKWNFGEQQNSRGYGGNDQRQDQYQNQYQNQYQDRYQGQYQDQYQSGYGYTNFNQDPWSKPKGKKSIKKYIIAIVGVIVAGIIIASIFGNGPGIIKDDYIANVYIDGTITDGVSNDGYSQEWLKDTIEDLQDDKHNKGIMLRLNTPGGGVNPTADIYEMLENYKKETGRPVYAYMDTVAASGGYYISMTADQIYANPECWTGSIGVIVGNIYDFSELLNKLGIKVTTIVSGPNKGMGNPTQPMTDEQKKIYQSIVDDSYSRFLAVVEKGRKMDEATLKPLADGRIYTANQAKANGLIDEVANEDTSKKAMQERCHLENCDFRDFKFEKKPGLFDDFLGIKSLAKILPKNQYETVLDFVEENQQVDIMYLAPVKK